MSDAFLRELQLVVLSVRNPSPEHVGNIYDDAYGFWHSIWLQTLRHLDGPDVQLHGDEFTRQDCALNVLWRGKVVMQCLMRTVDLDLPSYRGDSYFKNWPEAALRGVTRDSRRVMIASNMGLDPSIRGACEGVSMKDLLATLVVDYTRQSGVSTLVSVTRNDRGMNRMAERAGGTLLYSRFPLHGVETDIHAYYMKDLVGFRNEWSFAAHALWQSRIVSDATPAPVVALSSVDARKEAA